MISILEIFYVLEDKKILKKSPNTRIEEASQYKNELCY